MRWLLNLLMVNFIPNGRSISKITWSIQTFTPALSWWSEFIHKKKRPFCIVEDQRLAKMLGSTKEVVRRISPWVPELLKSGASTAQLQNLVKLDPLPKVGQSKKKINIHQSELPKTSVPQIRVPKNAHGKIWTCISKLMTWVVQVSRSKIICGKYSICCIPSNLWKPCGEYIYKLV